VNRERNAAPGDNVHARDSDKENGSWCLIGLLGSSSSARTVLPTMWGYGSAFFIVIPGRTYDAVSAYLTSRLSGHQSNTRKTRNYHCDSVSEAHSVTTAADY
jgi:hypothetical protein